MDEQYLKYRKQIVEEQEKSGLRVLWFGDNPINEEIYLMLEELDIESCYCFVKIFLYFCLLLNKTNMISAKVITDSKNTFGDRLTTFVLTFPRLVLAEFNTHRMLSKNSASSRAIPFSKPQTRSGMVERAQDNPFIPIRWMREHKGMQGTEYFTEEEVKSLSLLEDHLIARDNAVVMAKKQSDKGLTKQIVNRYLEPFMYHTVIATGNAWQNFFSLRAEGGAEIHIQDLAFKMLEAYNESIPKQLNPGEWHIPFGDSFDETKIQLEVLDKLNKRFDSSSNVAIDALMEAKVKIATARCARISYNNFEGNDDYAADVKLMEILSKSGHFSPMEHCARAMSEIEYKSNYIVTKVNELESITEYGLSGNLKGFVQYRKMFEGENRKDSRVIIK